MVQMFMIGSVTSQPPVLLYAVPFSNVLDAGAFDDDGQCKLSEEAVKIRRYRKKVAEDILNKVKAEFDFNTSVGFPSPFGLADKLLDPYPREYETGGVFSCKIGNVEKVVCWHSLRGRAYVLLCEKHENRMLAGHILIHLIGKIQEYLPSNILLLETVQKIEIVSALVNTYLPNGQLLFAHRRVLKHMDQELHKLISNSL